MNLAEQLQHQYYTENANRYDDLYLGAVEHAVALRYMVGLCRQLQVKSILDIGSGTGRAVRFFLESGFDAYGVEPVEALTEQAITKHGIPPERLRSGKGESLPFGDASFDVVCETGVLHHVSDPAAVVREMTRIARQAIFLSDENRFGSGGLLGKLFHIMLYKVGLWRPYYWLRTGGRGYTDSLEDGIRYSYSVYESLPQLVDWADRLWIVPTKGRKSASWLGPLLSASHALVCAVREPAGTC